MRPTETFTDGRIHVTLCDGPYDLDTLTAGERRVYDALVEAYRRSDGTSGLVQPDELDGQPVLASLCRDLWDRAVVEEFGEADEGELLPWQPEVVRRRVDRAWRQRRRVATAGHRQEARSR